MTLHRVTIKQLELVIALLIVGMLGCIVLGVARFATGTSEEETLAANLRTFRLQIELFRQQHGGIAPGRSGKDIVRQLTGRTDRLGQPRPNGPFGPYLVDIPINPFNGRDTIEVSTRRPGGGDHGWHYDPVRGMLSPDDDGHKNR